MDADCAETKRAGGVRRSRVVLTPRRWRQASWNFPRWRWWQESPVTRESTYKSSSHCAGKAGVFPLHLYARVRFLLMHIAHETAGAARTRSSLRPLVFEGERFACLGRSVSRECGTMPRRHCEEHLRRSNPVFACGTGLLRFARNDDLDWLFDN